MVDSRMLYPFPSHCQCYLANDSNSFLDYLSTPIISPRYHLHPPSLPFTSGMCKARLWQSLACRHIWAAITKPCSDGKGFENCDSFKGQTRWMKDLPLSRAPPAVCPKCDKKDDYDGNKFRMVKGIASGMGIGYGAAPSNKGETKVYFCCEVM